MKKITYMRWIIVSLLALCGCVTASAQFAGGDGSPQNPYQVATAEHLNAVRDHLDAHFVQTADIDLGVAPWNEGHGWDPIGYYVSASDHEFFQGQYDGQGYAISGLFIDRARDRVGLFGSTEGAVIRNLRLVDYSVTGNDWTGGLIGKAQDTTIDLVVASGGVNGDDTEIGGLVGRMIGGGLQRTSVDAQVVAGGNRVGGVIGYAHENAQIRYVSVRGGVTGVNRVGGMIGYLREGTIGDAYSLAAVEGVDSVGGLVGRTGYWSHQFLIVHHRGNVSKSFSAGSVTGTGEHVGGLIGRNVNAPHVPGTAGPPEPWSSHNAWDVEASGVEESADDHTVPLTTGQMQTAASFPAWDFERVWMINEGHGYPQLRDLSGYSAEVPEAAALESLAGSGTVDDPYRVTSVAELLAVRAGLDLHWRLENDLNLEDALVWYHGQGWAPIGNAATPFTGEFDGGGHAIVNLRMNRAEHSEQGFFGQATSAHIHHVRLENANVSGRERTGLLAGRVTSSLVEGVEVGGRVSAQDHTGGLAGIFEGGILRRAAADVQLVGRNLSGGLIGHVNAVSGESAFIERVSSLGQVLGRNEVGGLVGHHQSGEIRDASSRVTIHANNRVGGLVGRAGRYWSGPPRFFQSGHIHRSYSSGAVHAEGEDVGGFLGHFGSADRNDFSDNYWNTETSGWETSEGQGAGEVMPRTTAQMTYPYEDETYDTWNFTGVWTDDPVGYPYLRPAAETGFAGGAGFLRDPYRIESAEQLDLVRHHLFSHFQIIAPIDLDVVPWNEDAGWIPIGSAGAGFTGAFDGNDMAVSGLTINRGGSDRQGLFGVVDSGRLVGVVLESADVSAQDRSGILAGELRNGSQLENCRVSGLLEGRNHIGGLAGRLDSGTRISDSRSAAEVAGSDHVGGLVGSAVEASSIFRSVADGAVAGTGSVGGLVGQISTDASVRESFASADVTGTGATGGLVGTANDAIIEDTYATGAVQGGTAGGLLGSLSGGAIHNSHAQGEMASGSGLIGSVSGEFEIKSAYWNIEMSSRYTCAAEPKTVGRFTGEMVDPVNFADWDLVDVWGMGLGTAPTQPYLRAFDEEAKVVTFAPYPTDVRVTGLDIAGETLSGHYIFNSGSEGLDKGATTFQWWWAASPTDSFAPIDGETGLTIMVTEALVGGTFRFEVTVRNDAGSVGTPRYADLYFTGGMGTEADPYEISTASQLQRLNARTGQLYESQHYRITADIDLDVAPWNSGQGWEPIGSSSSPFMGTVDGGGHTVSGLTINRNASHQGLFGSIEDAEIRDLSLTEASVSITGGANRIGALFGTAVNALVMDIALDAVVSASGENIGGLGGYAEQSRIDRIVLEVEVSGGAYTGGLLGYAEDSDIDRIDAHTTVSSAGGDVGGVIGFGDVVRVQRVVADVDVEAGGWNVGGLLGRSHGWIHAVGVSGHVSTSGSSVGGLVGQQSSQHVFNAYSDVTVTGADRVGGLVGESGWSVTMSRAFSAGAVHGEGSDIDSLVGHGDPTRHYLYWNTEAPGHAQSDLGEGLTAAEMADAESFPLFNFFTIWEMKEASSTPTLQKRWDVPAAPREVALEDLSGSGTAADPYLLHDASELRAMRLDLNAHYRLAEDIEAAETAFWFDGRGWGPVGNFHDRFNGYLDGDGHVIRNLTVNRGADQYGGLLGYATSCVVRNLDLYEANIFSAANAGTLIGLVHGVELDNITVTAVVGSTGHQAGGLVGRVGHSGEAILSRLAFSGRVIGLNNVGGLVGDQHSSGIITQATVDAGVRGLNNVGGLIGLTTWGGSHVRLVSVSGSVSGASRIGGLIGRNERAIISDVYSLADISGTGNVGGLIGQQEDHSHARIHRGYASGAVVGDSEVGGLIGSGHSGRVFNCFWDTEISGQESSVGGTGLSTVEMQQQASYVTYNFETVWQIEEGAGTPEFRDFSGYSVGPEPVALADVPGSGVAEDPYRLSTPSHLHAVRQAPSAHFVLEADIDLADTAVWNHGQGWDPIGSSGDRFSGVFDGDGHVIRNLATNRLSADRQALFAYLNSGGVIRNLNLENANIQGESQSGILVGHANGAIDNVNVQGNVIAAGHSVGGLGGNIGGASAFVSRVFANAQVSGTWNVGGLIGHCGSNTVVRYSASVGEVYGSNIRIGGLIGLNEGGQIADVYSQAAVVGAGHVGGLIGVHERGARLDRAYAYGAVSGNNNVGGLIGSISGSVVSHGFWDTETSGQAESAGGIGVGTAELRQQATFPVFNFASAWTIEEGIAAPVFQDLSLHAVAVAEEVDLSELAGSGTEADPYIVTSASELHAIRQDMTAHYRLGTDIDLSESLAWNHGRGWDSIGNNYNRFSGTLDGAGHSIYGLTVNRPTSTYQGLFGSTASGALLQDITLASAHVYGGRESALLAGEMISGSQVQGVNLSGVLVASAWMSGSVVGRGQGIAISEVFADVHVEGRDRTGGMVGYLNSNASIERSYVLGTVIGANRTGGLVGYSYSNGQITDSFARAQVIGSDEVGGLVGHQERTASSRILRCYAIGTVTGSGSHVGGLLGRLSHGTVVDSYYNTDFSDDAGGGGEGRTTIEMTYPASSDTYEGWDFETVWMADTTFTLNDGYPVLIGSSLAPVRLVYTAGPGGHLTGPLVQDVVALTDGEEVFAIAESGAVFARWSDGVIDNPRRDLAVTAPIEVTAHFHSAGDVEIDWYAEHGIAPTDGQNWADLDALDLLGKGMTLRMEFLAGTDPNNVVDRFTAHLEDGEIHFYPSHADRRYTLWRSGDLVEWSIVPGQGDVPGGNGPLIDANPPGGGAFYRVEVALP